MNTLQLKLFLSVSRTLNFTRTAEEFFMSQPTVSNHIRSLEQELGTALLTRSSHRVALTAAGRELTAYAGKILELQSSAELRLRNLRHDRPGHVRIAMLSSAAALFFAAMERFTRKWPMVQVDVTMLEGSQMLQALNKREHDLFFANEPMLPQSGSDLAWTITGQEQLQLFVHKRDLPDICMDDWTTVGRHYFVSMQTADFTLSSQIETICANRGIQPDIISYYNRADMLLLGVASGVGVAILPPQMAHYSACENVTALSITGDDATLRSVLAWSRDLENPDAVRFRDMALATVTTVDNKCSAVPDRHSGTDGAMNYSPLDGSTASVGQA